MPTYWRFMKRVDSRTGELPHTLTLELSRKQVFVLLKQIVMQLELNPPIFRLELHGLLKPDLDQKEPLR